MKVRLKKDYDSDFIAGSVIEVTKENKKTYVGFWYSMWGSYKVKVNKEDCEPYVEEMDTNILKDYVKNNGKRKK